MRGKAQRVARPEQTSLQKPRVHRTKVHQIFIRRRGATGGVNARIHIAILPCYVMPTHRMKVVMPIFADSRQKSVTIATSLERWRKGGSD